MATHLETRHDWKVIRRVLAAFGYSKPTYGQFHLWDGLIDWNATVKLMDMPPTKTALCHILDQYGKLVMVDNKPVVVARDLVARTEAEATEILRRSSHVFVGWWPSDSQDWRDAGSNQCGTPDEAERKQSVAESCHGRVVEATGDFLSARKGRPKPQQAKRMSKEMRLF